MKKNSEFDLFFEKADVIYLHQHAGVAELADALRSGRSGSNPVGVQIPPPVLDVRTKSPKVSLWGFFVPRAPVHPFVFNRKRYGMAANDKE